MDTMNKVVFNTETMQSNQQQHRLWRKPKRFRSAFTTEQINYLETLFKKFPYIDRDKRKEVAAILKMEERPIKIWFQNRRMKEKKEHKEFDVETNSYPQELSKDQLNNVPAMPSTNGQQSHSLPVLTSIAAATAEANTYNMDINKDEHKITITNPDNVSRLNTDLKASHPNASYYKEISNQVYMSPYFQQKTNSTTLPTFTNNVKNVSAPSQVYKSNTSAEFSINLWKKYKQKSAATNPAAYDNNVNQVKNTKKKGPTLLSKGDTQHDGPKDFSTKKKPKLTCPAPAPSKPSQHVPLSNPAYYPVMPTIYTSPFMSPGSVLWNPVNFMPVMTTNAPPIAVANCHGPREQSKNCKCNCHGSTQHVPISLPPSLQNPYTQYVINVPYQRTSP